MTLKKAILNNDVSTVRRLLLENPAAIEERPEGQWLPALAARCGDTELVRYLVEYSRASFDQPEENGRTILHAAVESGNPELVRYLVERVGMSPVTGDRELLTPYELAEQLRKQKEAEGGEEADGYARIVDYFERYCGFSLQDAYKNPILTGMHPDPSIVRVGDDFYMVNSSFLFFPCIPISHSRDLIHWEVIGHAITNPEWSGLGELEGGRGYWAPDISYSNGRFYITATYRRNDVPEAAETYAQNATPYRRQMIVSSERPEGPYSKPVFLEEDGIDPSLFTDTDGKRYLLLNRGARIFEVDPDEGRQLSEAVLLYYGHQKRAPEGAHLLKKDGWYYLFQAEGGTGPGHRISVSRSAELFGVYTPCPYNPILRQQDPGAAIQRCGHGKPVLAPDGAWYMVYLCGRQLEGKYSMLGRETALDRITWTEDGWPLVNGLQGPSVLAKKPPLPQAVYPSEGDGFGMDGRLSREWVTVREPEEAFAELREDGLWLKGSKTALSDRRARNLLLRRQTAFSFLAETVLDAGTLREGQNAGLTCYYDENSYLIFGVFRQNGACLLKVQEHVDCDTWDSFVTELSEAGEVTLCCETEGLSRSFYRRTGEQKQLLGTLERVTYLCDEGLKKGKRFTGAMVGVYAETGAEENRIRFADFAVR